MKMLDYICEQPDYFAWALENRKQIARPFVELFAQIRPDRLYIIASGTSRNGAATAAPFMSEALAMDVTVSAPSRVYQLYGGNPLVIYVSQGGNSTNTIAAMDRLAAYPSIALTGDHGRICDLCTQYLHIPCGDETVGPKTKGYTLTILTLYLMAMEAGLETGRLPQERYDAYVAALQVAAGQFEINVQRTMEWQRRNDAALCGIKLAYLVGKRQCLPIAQEGALKLQETILVPTAAYDFEEFLHGPASSIQADTAGFYLLPPVGDPDRDRMQKLLEFHRGCCPQAYALGADDTTDTRDYAPQTAGVWYTQPFELILPMQMVGAVIPEELKLEGNGSQTFRKLDKLLNIKYKGADGEDVHRNPKE